MDGIIFPIDIHLDGKEMAMSQKLAKNPVSTPVRRTLALGWVKVNLAPPPRPGEAPATPTDLRVLGVVLVETPVTPTPEGA